MALRPLWAAPNAILPYTPASLPSLSQPCSSGCYGPCKNVLVRLIKGGETTSWSLGDSRPYLILMENPTPCIPHTPPGRACHPRPVRGGEGGEEGVGMGDGEGEGEGKEGGVGMGCGGGRRRGGGEGRNEGGVVGMDVADGEGKEGEGGVDDDQVEGHGMRARWGMGVDAPTQTRVMWVGHMDVSTPMPPSPHVG